MGHPELTPEPAAGYNLVLPPSGFATFPRERGKARI